MLTYWLWLALMPTLQERDKRLLLEHFRDPEEIYYAGPEEWKMVEGITEAMVEALKEKDLSEAEKVLSRCEETGIQLITWEREDYPYKLKNIPDPPLVLYAKGRLPDFAKRPSIGVVGTRRASAYGLEVAKRLGYQIGKCGGLVVSGMADGIDGMAMRGALTAGTPAVGVLGCGVDMVYPVSNRELYRQTQECGCLLSEYPPGTAPFKWNFPKRNRIISGMCDGVLVVEAPEKSGALITARLAADQGRDVFVVPGNIDVTSCAGSNALLREGAQAVCSGWDVVSEYQAIYPGMIHKMGSEAEPMVAQTPVRPKPSKPDDKKGIDKNPSLTYSDGVGTALSETEQRVLSLLNREGRLADDLIAETGLAPGQVLAALTTLRIKGLVAIQPGGRFTRER